MDEKQRMRHQSIANSLVRSLASSLSKMDAESFLGPKYGLLLMSPSSSYTPPAPGEYIESYELLESIGLGGMQLYLLVVLPVELLQSKSYISN